MKRRRTKLKQILSLLKNNQKLNLNDKIETIKTLKKKPRKKKLKVEGPNRKTLYIYKLELKDQIENKQKFNKREKD
jgi:hypothetical protein